MMLSNRQSFLVMTLSSLAINFSSATSRAQTTLVYSDIASFRAALTLPVVIDFDSLAGGTVLTGNEFSGQGLTFSHLDGKLINVISSPPVAAGFARHFGSLPNAISSSYSHVPRPGYSPVRFNLFYNDNHSDNIRFSFSDGASAAGVFLGENDSDGVGVRFLDGSGNIILSRFFPRKSPEDIFLGIVSSVPIAAMELVEAANDIDGIVIDNIVFQRSTSSGYGQLEAISRALAVLIADFQLDLFNGANMNAKEGQRASLATRVQNAGHALRNCQSSATVALLRSVLKRVDGASSPTDWMHDSAEKRLLADLLRGLLDLLDP